MSNFTDILPFILPETPQCPRILAANHAVRAARELCRESKVWNVSGTFSPVANAARYELVDLLDIPNDSEINMINGISQAGTPLTRGEIVDMDANSVGWRAETSKNASSFIPENRRIILIYPFPDATATDDFTASVSLRPTLTASEIDQDLYADYGEAIAYGALYSLMTIPNKPWTNLVEAQNKLIQFNYWIERATQDTVRGFSDEDMIVRVE